MIDDVDLVGQRLAGEAGLDVGVVDVVGELAGDLDVLVVAVGAQPLVALLAVLLAQGVGIEWELGCRRHLGSFAGKSRIESRPPGCCRGAANAESILGI